MDHKICRLCSENSDGVSIFETDCDGILFSTKVMYCCSKIEIKDNDGLPSQICCYCENDLVIAYRFVLKCEETDITLRNKNQNLSKSSNLTVKAEIKDESSDAECGFLGNDTMDDPPDELEVKPRAICQNIQLKSTKTSEGSTKNTNKTIKRRKSNKGSQCLECGRKCINPSTLAIHMRSHTEDRPFPCTLCHKKYKDPSTLKRHMEQHLTSVRDNFQCATCSKEFYSRTGIINHVRTHLDPFPFKCTECAAVYSQTGSLIRHKKMKHGKRTETCNVCTKKFYTKQSLQQHSLAHSISKKEFACNICHKLFKYKNNLNMHYRSHINPIAYVCDHCGHTFSTKGNLVAHVHRIHSDNSGYCETCRKIVSNIEVHKLRHSGERRLKCELCTKLFFDAKALNYHVMFSHKETGKYKCTVKGCPRGFPSKPMLDWHVAKLHEKQTKFSCDQCSRSFYRKCDLTKHKMGTHNDKLPVVKLKKKFG